MKLEVCRSSGPPIHDLAFEAEMLDRAATGRASAMVTTWRGPVVVLGYAQSPGDVDLDWCREKGIPVLRRLSGGTGVVHSGDLGVSLALPVDHPWAGRIIGLYDRFLGVLQPVLRRLGSGVERMAAPGRGSRVRSPICFEDQLADTLLVGGRKAVGCSQVRRKGGVLIHAVVLLGLDAELYARIFGVEEARVKRALAPALTIQDTDRLFDELITRLALDLESEIELSPRTGPDARHLAKYTHPGRWTIGPNGGNL
jgi:lipoate-protein ligase A